MNFKGYSSDLFALYPRYVEGNFDNLENEINGITINGNLLIGEFGENIDESVLLKKSEFVLIGSIRT